MGNNHAAFAIPGELATLTGGYLYDRQVIDGLSRLGWSVEHVALGASFPEPGLADRDKAAHSLCAVPRECPLIIDGLALGALEPDLLGRIAAPIIALVHHPLAYETGLTAAQSDRLFRSEQAALGFARYIVVTSPHTARVLQSDYGVSAERITIAVPGTQAAMAAPRRVTSPPLLLSVGILVRRKGHDVLLQALARLTDIPWQAVIVGEARDADHAAELAALAQSLGLSGKVRFAGRVSDGDLAELYAQAYLFTLATRYEGYGIVFNEAMAHGLPIVSCNAGAVADTVAPDASLLVAPEDPEALAAALRSVLSDADVHAQLALGSQAAGSKLGGWDQTAQAFDQVLREAMRMARHEG